MRRPLRKVHRSCLLAFGLAAIALPAAAETFVGDWDLSVGPVNVITDRIGNSRFFANANKDTIRVSAWAQPSPDTDYYGVSAGGDLHKSLNGGQTSVGVTHASFDSYNYVLPLTFVGFRSTGGGSMNEYTTTFDLAGGIAPYLDAVQTTPFRIVASNPAAPNGSVSVDAPDFNLLKLPFLTDVKLTGGGLQPTISWTVPEGEGGSITNVRVQVRRIDAESADRSRITAATLVHEAIIPLTDTSYQFDEIFSNAGVAGFPSGLEEGHRYEVSVVLESRYENRTLARARTFFEFMPLPEGDTQVAVFLPSVGPDGAFKFDVKVEAGETIAIDPVVAIGYDYVIGDGDPNFASVTLPDVGDGLYELYLFDGTDWVFETLLAHDDPYSFGEDGVDRFRILGIETGAGLDPSDPVAFITRLTFAGDGRFTGTMTPITAQVPEPATPALIGMALLATLAVRRRPARPRAAR